MRAPERQTTLRARALAITCALLLALPAAALVRAAAVDEQEPNDGAPTAQRIAVGDTVRGTIDRHGDADWYRVGVLAGERLRVAAEWTSFSMDLGLVVLGSDGELLAHDSIHDQPLVLLTPQSGDSVFVVVYSESLSDSGPNYRYRLTVEPVPPTPADPPTLLRYGSAGYGVAAGPHGELAFTRGQLDIAILFPDAEFEERIYLFGMNPVYGVTYDAFGRILVRANDGDVLRLDENGAVERHIETTCQWCAYAAAIDPAGNVLIQVAPGVVALHDPLLESELSRVTLAPGIGGFSALGAMAYDASGDLLYTDVDRTRLRVVDMPSGTAVRSFVAPSRMAGFAIDSLGYVYAPTERHGLLRIAPDLQSYETVALEHVTRALVVFRNDGNGNPTDRLVMAPAVGYGTHVWEFDGVALAPGLPSGPRLRVATDVVLAQWGHATTVPLALQGGGSATWSVVAGALPPGLALADGAITGTPTAAGRFEVAVRAQIGQRYGVALVQVLVHPPATLSLAAIADYLLGEGTLTEGERAFLDAHGNANGAVDLGDLVAFERDFGDTVEPFSFDGVEGER